MSWTQKRGTLPGFGLTIGFTLFYLSVLVLIPLAGLFLKTATTSWEHIWASVASARALAAYKLSFGASLLSAVVNSVFGLLLAWVLARYQFPGRRLVDGLVDLPFALPTAVAGITLTTLLSKNGWVGRPLGDLGLKVAYTQLGVVVALIFVSLPFVVRTVQPVLEDLRPESEEAAASLGAGRLQTFRWVILPEILPALLTGFALSFARALGEYGSVVFISGNMPMRTEIVPLLIVTKLEQYDYTGATAIASAMLIVSFVLLLCVQVLERYATRARRIGR